MKICFSILAILLLGGCANSGLHHPDSGVIRVESAHDVATTTARLTATLAAKGFKIFSTVNHDAGAASVGNTLRPTRVVIFGNPAIGSLLMQCAQTTAIDLPQKMLIYQDGDGTVWLAYNDPFYLSARHEMLGCNAQLGKVANALAGITRNVALGDE